MLFIGNKIVQLVCKIYTADMEQFLIKPTLKCPYCNFVHLSDIAKLQAVVQLRGVFLLNVTR